MASRPPTIAFVWILAIVGIFVGGGTGFVLRPEVPGVGPVPFNHVVTRGASLSGVERIAVTTAQASFNQMVLGAVLGLCVGLLLGLVTGDRTVVSGSASTWGLVVFVLLVILLHQDYWFWTDRTLVAGFLPIGLAYHIGFAVLASLTMWLLVRTAWPGNLEAEYVPQSESTVDSGGDS